MCTGPRWVDEHPGCVMLPLDPGPDVMVPIEQDLYPSLESQE